MKKTIKEANSKEKQKEFVKFAKTAQQKEEEYQRLLNTIPDLKKSNKSEIKKWYKDFVDLLFK
jgi:uncharacterized protein HemY